MMQRVASLLGCTEGQAYTAVIALAVSLSMASFGLPPTLESRAFGQATTDGSGLEPRSSEQQAAQEPQQDENASEGAGDLDLPEAAQVEGPGPTSRGADASVGGDHTGLDGPGEDASGPGDEVVLQEESLEDRFGTASLFARVGEPGAPHGVAVDEEGHVYVSTDNGAGRGESGPSTVFHYGPDGELVGEMTVEDQNDARLRGVPDLVVDHENRLLALDTASGRILHLDLESGTQRLHAELPDLGPCAVSVGDDPCQPGARRHAPRPTGAAVSSDGSLFVTDPAQATIWRVTHDGEVAVWHQDAGYRTGVLPQDGLAGLAFDEDGHLLVVLAPFMPAASVAEGEIHRIEIGADGGAGNSEVLVTTETGKAPADVVAGASGRLYVTLTGSDELLVLAADGSEEDRIAADDIADGAGVPLDAPAGLAFRGESLLVANSAIGGEDEHWAVIEVSVEDVAADDAGWVSGHAPR